MPNQNDNFQSMLQIMRNIGLESHVNGEQKQALYGWAWYKFHYSSSAIYLDVGTNKGNSAIVLASAIKHQNPGIPKRVYTVDNYCESHTVEADIETAKRNISAFGIDDLVEIHVADAVEFVDSLPDGSIDMIFDDGGHSYDDTLARLNAYVPKMNTNCLITAHDYYVNFPGIVKAFDDFRKGHFDIVSNLNSVPGMCWMFCKLEV